MSVDGEESAPDADRRAALRTISRGVGATTLGVLAGGCLSGLVAHAASASASASTSGSSAAAAAASSVRADPVVDIQMLQTASSLETLLVNLYGDALGTGPAGKEAPSAKAIAAIPDAAVRETLVQLLAETQAHHREHRLAFQALTTALGGKQQNEPNPKYASGATAADLSTPLRLVDYAAVLEEIVTGTYVLDLTLADNVKAKETLASVMAVEAQHLAVFRVVGALLRADTVHLVRIPIGNDLVNLPATLATVAFPLALDDLTSSVAEPESGAVP